MRPVGEALERRGFDAGAEAGGVDKLELLRVSMTEQSLELAMPEVETTKRSLVLTTVVLVNAHASRCSRTSHGSSSGYVGDNGSRCSAK